MWKHNETQSAGGGGGGGGGAGLDLANIAEMDLWVH